MFLKLFLFAFLSACAHKAHDVVDDPAHLETVQGVEALQAKADKGDPEAATRVGEIFLFGPPNVRNTDYARKYLTRATRRGHKEGAEILAGMYVNGYGVEPDPHRAARIYETCALQGHGPCQFNLGILYKNGDTDFPKNPKKAYFWLYKASINPELEGLREDAAQYRNEIGAELTQEDRQEIFRQIYARRGSM